MDKLRLYAWLAFAGVLVILYSQWQRDYPPPAPPPPPVASAAPSAAALPDLPGAPSSGPPPTAQMAAEATPAIQARPNVGKVNVRTDVFDLDISLQGGELVRADLLKYPLDKDKPDQPVRLFDVDSSNYFLARSGLRATQENAAPSHQAIYQSAATHYVMDAGQDTLSVPLTWTNDQGVVATKTFTFKRGHYAIAIDYELTNKSSAEVVAASYLQLARRQPVIEASMFEAESYAFTGPTVYGGEKEGKRNFKLADEDDKSLQATYTGGWIAAMQHHFVVAAVPKVDQAYDYDLKVESPQQFTVGYRGPVTTIAPGTAARFSETVFAGPKLQSQLEATGPKLDLAADYGVFTIISKPLFLVLNFVHDYVGNWGWAIILVTFLIKLVFYKLTEASGKSMAKMREMAPRMKAMQERYKDNREELGRATMEFYKREKINPLAGCLPMLIQMPVFMAFYWVLLNSAEMRQAPFIGYLSDLSSRDPYFILPALLGVLNFAQFKLNPAPADPVQAKVMMFMPILMTGMMVLFPSGLVLYWITNTGLSILQQWHINRVVAGAAKKT